MSTTAKRRLLIILLLGLIPWTVVTVSGTVTLVLPFGLIDAQSWRLLTLPEYLRLSGGRIAPFIEAWPLSVFLYAGTLVSAIGGVFGREDPRLTGGFLVLTAVGQLPFVFGLSQRFGYTAIPVGIVLMLAAAWWFYWPMVRASSG